MLELFADIVTLLLAVHLLKQGASGVLLSLEARTAISQRECCSVGKSLSCYSAVVGDLLDEDIAAIGHFGCQSGGS